MGSAAAARSAGSVERSVLAAYAAYFADFQRFDPVATAAHFTAPLSRVSRAGIRVCTSVADVRDWLAATGAHLRARGYGGATTTSRTVTVLDPHTALLRARGVRHDRSGAPLEDFDVLYLLVRGDGGDPWRIAVVTPVDPAGTT